MQTPRSLSLARSGGLDVPHAFQQFMTAVDQDLQAGVLGLTEIPTAERKSTTDIPLVELTWKGETGAVDGERIRIHYLPKRT